jgi:hypothetical protein
MSVLLEAAREYRARNLAVIPVGQDKHPLVEWKRYQDELPHLDQVDEWWFKFPSANVGTVTGKISGLVVLDADGPQGLASLKALGTPATTWVSLTGRPEGGWQQFFRHPGNGTTIGNRAGLRSGLDVRGDGGFVVLPPSLHASGRRYEWLTPPDKCSLAALPEKFFTWLREPERIETAAQGQTIPQGQRNDTLFRIGRGLAAKGATESTITVALLEENRLRCRPPLPEADVRLMAKHVMTQPNRPDFNASPASGPEIQTDGQPAAPLLWSARDFIARERRHGSTLIPALGGRRGGKLGLYGPGGSGTSYGFLNIAAAAAEGRPLLGHPPWQVASRLRVGFLSLEDPASVQVERLARLLPHFELTTVPEHLYVFDRDVEERGFVLAGSRGLVNDRAFDRLDQCLGDLKLDLLLIEPKVYLLETDENSNTENMPWQRRLQALLIRHGALLIIGHHAGWGQDGKIHARGGSSYRDWVDGMIQQTADEIQGRLLLEGRLVCQPFEDEKEKGYTFAATGTYRRLGVPVVESVNVGGGPNGIRTRVSALRGHILGLS